MLAHVNAKHPRVHRPYPQKCCCRTRNSIPGEKHSLLFTDTGAHSCYKPKESELSMYGVGISLYFKFVKFMVVVYLVLSLLALPSLIIYSLGGKLEDVESTVAWLPYVTSRHLSVLCRCK